MPIQNLNGVSRKHAKPIAGTIFGNGLVSQQHGTVRIGGTSYNSPFTHSSKSVFPTGKSIATQPVLPPLKAESPGTVVPLHQVVKIHPNEKGSVLHKTVHHIAYRAGGPSKDADTPANPNATSVKTKVTARPPRRQPNLAPEKTTNLSFLRSGGTLSAKSDQDSRTSRWAVTKKGAVI